MLARFVLSLMLCTPALAAIPQDLISTTTPIGHLAGGLSQGSGLISADNSRLIFPGEATNLTPADRENFSGPLNEGATAQGLRPIHLFVDGIPTPASAQYTSPVFSPDSRHVGYAFKSRDKWHCVVDDKTLVADADAVSDTPIVFSADSQHVATIVQKDYKWHVTVDGKPWPILSTPQFNLGSFSLDGKHFLAVGHTKNSSIIYLDGIALSPLFDIKLPLERMFLSYNWKPDGSAIGFYGAFPGKHWQVFTTDVPPFESPQFDNIMRGSPVFSPDSSRFAYGAQSRGKWAIITDSDASTTPPFDELAPQTVNFLYSEKSTPSKNKLSLIYIARRGPLCQLYVDHQPMGDPFDQLLDGTFTLSTDRKHYAFAIGRGGQTTIIRDGKPLAQPERVGPNTLTFSPDSQHLAYTARVNFRWRIAIDGKPASADFVSIAPNSISFSPDSRTVAFTAALNPGAARLYVGADAGFQSTFFDEALPGAGVTWRDNTHLVTIVVTKHVAYRLEAKIPTK